MPNESEIKDMIKKEKSPSSRKYMAIFLVFALIAAAYIIITNWDAVKGMLQTKSSVKVESKEEAGQVSSNLGKSLQNASSVLDDIGRSLG